MLQWHRERELAVKSRGSSVRLAGHKGMGCGKGMTPLHPFALGVESGEKFFFLNFQVKMHRVLCIFIAKKYLWPEIGTGGV